MEQLNRIASEIFSNEVLIAPGVYTAEELAKSRYIRYYPEKNKSVLMRSVCVATFKCEFERKNIFQLVWSFEGLTRARHKDRVRFVRSVTEQGC